jgi:hypothetical protein
MASYVIEIMIKIHIVQSRQQLSGEKKYSNNKNKN